METKTKATEQKLKVTRLLKAPRDKVFAAWTDAEAVKKWFCPVGFTVRASKIDLRVGGDYRITMISPKGETVEHFGTYREILPPERLVFSWILDDQDCGGSQGSRKETLVTVEFRDNGETTELVLTHKGFPTKESCEGHQFGWNSCLDHFDQVFG